MHQKVLFQILLRNNYKNIINVNLSELTEIKENVSMKIGKKDMRECEYIRIKVREEDAYEFY